jgi:hypothetical protein
MAKAHPPPRKAILSWYDQISSQFMPADDWISALCPTFLGNRSFRMSTRKQTIAFVKDIETVVASGRTHRDMRNYDLERLSRAVDVTQDRRCHARALQSLKEYYFHRDCDNRIMETSRMLWMRFAIERFLRGNRAKMT